MITDNFTFKDGEGVEIYAYKWSPDKDEAVNGVIQISHGMAEMSSRYEGFAKFLTDNGYLVYSNDHRGHGKTAGNLEDIGYLGESDGFAWMIEDMHQLTSIIKKDNPNLPVILFGHSMGSFLTQGYVEKHGNELRGAILSGSNGKQGLILKIGKIIARAEIGKIGRKGRSELLNNMSFGSYNKSFKPCRTDFDWLSRDSKIVDKYIDDPYCGGVFTASFYYDFLNGLSQIEKSKNIENIPKNLPIFIISGALDPVGKNGKGVEKLVETYKKFNIHDVTYKLYKDGRHEILNELNKDEVMKDILEWLRKHIIAS